MICGFACHYSRPIFFWVTQLSSLLCQGFSFLVTPPEKIVKKYNELGVEGIKNRKQKSLAHRREKQPLLNPEHWQKLIAALRQRPADGGIWTVSKVARWIEKETQREKVSNLRGWDYLKKCGYS